MLCNVNNLVFNMHYCPKCGTLVQEDAVYCPNCGTHLTRQPQPMQPNRRYHTVPARDTRRLIILGYISAILSLFIVPEIFGSVAIILGAYTRRRGGGSKVLILGFIFMFAGLFFTAYFSLFNLLPS